MTKWLLIGRFKAQSIPIWSLGYFRFWVVMTMMRTSPATMFIGTPIYNAYLRLMGAKIGRNVVIASRNPPVCADMITIGDNTHPAQGLDRCSAIARSRTSSTSARSRSAATPSWARRA